MTRRSTLRHWQMGDQARADLAVADLEEYVKSLSQQQDMKQNVSECEDREMQHMKDKVTELEDYVKTLSRKGEESPDSLWTGRGLQGDDGSDSSDTAGPLEPEEDDDDSVVPPSCASSSDPIGPERKRTMSKSSLGEESRRSPSKGNMANKDDPLHSLPRDLRQESRRKLSEGRPMDKEDSLARHSRSIQEQHSLARHSTIAMDSDTRRGDVDIGQEGGVSIAVHAFGIPALHPDSADCKPASFPACTQGTCPLDYEKDVDRLVQERLVASHGERCDTNSRMHKRTEYLRTPLGGVEDSARGLGWDLAKFLGCGPAGLKGSCLDDCSRSRPCNGTEVSDCVKACKSRALPNDQPMTYSHSRPLPHAPQVDFDDPRHPMCAEYAREDGGARRLPGPMRH